jgi:hypothetical protein
MALQISEGKKNEVVITLTGPIDQAMIDHVVKYMRYMQVLRKSKASQADIDKLVDEVDTAMWRKRRKRMAS